MPISGIKRILVGADFSKASKTALGQAARLAVTCDATLEVAHVIPSSILEHIALPESDIREDAETRLNEFLTDVSELNRIKPEKSLLLGTPARTLAERAATTGADLIVVGAHGGHFLRDLFAEPTAITVLRQHAKPVLMVKRAPSREYRRIVVATDFSAASIAAAETAARMTHDADLRALHVFEAMFEGKMLQANCDAETIDHHRKLAEIQSMRRMANFTTATEQMKRFTGVVRYGHATREILKYTEEVRADLIVVGVPQRSAISRLLFSRVTSHLVQSSSPDLLLVPGNNE